MSEKTSKRLDRLERIAADHEHKLAVVKIWFDNIVEGMKKAEVIDKAKGGN